MKVFDWNKLSDKRKKEISKEKPIFLCGPVDISEKRILQLIKQLSSKRKLLFGILKDQNIPGLVGEQFMTLSLEKLQDIIEQSEIRNTQYEILNYYQRDWNYILEELDFSAVILVNGSWHKQLHLRKELWTIIEKKVPYKLVSRFVDLDEAKEYANALSFSNKPHPSLPFNKGEVSALGRRRGLNSDTEIFKLVDEASSHSFDWTFQIGVVLVKDGKVILTSHNKVVPFETYTMHFGSSREKTFTPQNDQNNYDAVHAEVESILNAIKNKVDIKDSTMYINVMPCPSCARMIADSEIKEVVYKLDHSEGYALKLLTEAGKTVRRIV